MEAELQDEMREAISFSVKTGFYDEDEIAEIIEDMFYDEDALDDKWIEQEITKQMKEQLAEEKLWDEVTDFDRLAKVFDDLNKEGIIAIHNAGYTRQDGEQDCFEVYSELKEAGVKVRGYCFYHTQDLERAIDKDIANLYIAFGDFVNNDTLAYEVGDRVVQLLRDAGFAIEWDGSLKNRILIEKIDWKKRHDNEDWSDERAFEIQLKSKK